MYRNPCLGRIELRVGEDARHGSWMRAQTLFDEDRHIAGRISNASRRGMRIEIVLDRDWRGHAEFIVHEHTIGRVRSRGAADSRVVHARLAE